MFVLCLENFQIINTYHHNHYHKICIIFCLVKTCWTKVENSLNPTYKIRAGHASITMESHQQHNDNNNNEEDVIKEGGEGVTGTRPSLLVFGGGDNNGDFYNDIASIDL